MAANRDAQFPPPPPFPPRPRLTLNPSFSSPPRLNPGAQTVYFGIRQRGCKDRKCVWINGHVDPHPGKPEEALGLMWWTFKVSRVTHRLAGRLSTGGSLTCVWGHLLFLAAPSLHLTEGPSSFSTVILWVVFFLLCDQNGRMLIFSLS